MTCPTPVINITKSQADRETTEPIVGGPEDDTTITVQGNCLAVREPGKRILLLVELKRMRML